MKTPTTPEGMMSAREQGDSDKTLSKIQAALRLKGFTLHRLADGCLLIERWGYSRSVDSLTQAAQFLAQIGGQP